MPEILNVTPAAVTPTLGTVLSDQGVPTEGHDDPRLARLAERAIARYTELCQPAALVAAISREEFDTIYGGDGANADDSPVARIYPRASHLAVFAVTIGARICDEITRLFAAHDFALGAMLDSAASEGTEMVAQHVENRWRDELAAARESGGDDGVMRFSPGYCGWHLSGQKKLFAALGPGAIGIDLLESCLMRPLKSISGVMIGGPKSIFAFDTDFPFCESCDTYSCRDRLAALSER